jgi:hypothetical protein
MSIKGKDGLVVMKEFPEEMDEYLCRTKGGNPNLTAWRILAERTSTKKFPTKIFLLTFFPD